MPYPYTIEYHPNGLGHPVAFKVYPLQEGQTQPFIAIAAEEEVKAWEAYQEAVNAKHTAQTPAPVDPPTVEFIPEPSLNGTGKKVKSGSK